MITVERHVGVLVETRLSGHLTREELTAFGQERVRTLRAVGADLVVCFDCRSLDVLSPELTAELVAALRLSRRSPFRRSALLVPEDRAVLGLQLDRIVREAQNPARRIFRDRDALIAWLSEVLTPEEQTRLVAFLGA